MCTLHHWEAVGLLVPSGRTASGYRQYDDGDLDRLHRVLVYRELGLPLDQVRALLDGEADPLTTLRLQHSLLTSRIDRLQQLAAAVARAVEARTMGISLDPHEVLEVFGSPDPTQYAEEGTPTGGRCTSPTSAFAPTTTALRRGSPSGCATRGWRNAQRLGD